LTIRRKQEKWPGIATWEAVPADVFDITKDCGLLVVSFSPKAEAYTYDVVNGVKGRLIEGIGAIPPERCAKIERQ